MKPFFLFHKPRIKFHNLFPVKTKSIRLLSLPFFLTKYQTIVYSIFSERSFFLLTSPTSFNYQPSRYYF